MLVSFEKCMLIALQCAFAFKRRKVAKNQAVTHLNESMAKDVFHWDTRLLNAITNYFNCGEMHFNDLNRPHLEKPSALPRNVTRRNRGFPGAYLQFERKKCCLSNECIKTNAVHDFQMNHL